jgi:hypothetical protein
MDRATEHNQDIKITCITDQFFCLKSIKYQVEISVSPMNEPVHRQAQKAI